MEQKEPTRAEVLKPNFLEIAIDNTRNWIFTHTKLFFSICAGGVIAAACVFGALKYVEVQQEKNREAAYDFIRKADLGENDALALGGFDALVASRPELKNSLSLIGEKTKLLSLGEDDSSLEDFLKEESRNPELPGSAKGILGLRLADYYFENERFQDSAETLASLDSGGLEDLRLYNLALVYLRMENYEGAKQSLNLLIKGYPDSILVQSSETLFKYL